VGGGPGSDGVKLGWVSPGISPVIGLRVGRFGGRGILPLVREVGRIVFLVEEELVVGRITRRRGVVVELWLVVGVGAGCAVATGVPLA
jgi:hypothetical protein